MQSLKEFEESLSQPFPPSDVSDYLLALWYDGKGDWKSSHEIIQDIEDASAAWIHAYLHRKEGDIGNADYWYRKAGKKRPSITLKEEWDHIAETLIHQ